MPPPVKDQIWWHGVNISEVYNRLAAEFPVKPLPRRKPQWQSVSAFFQRAAGEALLEDPGTPTRERPHSRSRTSRATVLLKSASFCRVVRNGSHAWRPASATAPKRGSNVQRKDGPSTMAMRRRPQSAPALLRNDMQGLVARKTHEYPLRQRMEDVAVQKRMEWLKREGRYKRDFIEGVDVLSDPILFDLKVKHNSAARAKSAAPKTAALPSTPGTSKRPTLAHDKTSVEKLRGLCSALAKDTHSHCTRLQIPPKLVEGKGAQLLFEKLDAVLKQYPALRRPEEKLEEEKHDLGASFAHSLQGLIGGAAASAGDLTHPLVRLAYFLDGGRPGRLHVILEVLDRCRNGMLQSEDFCLGVELVGFAAPDYSALWGMLDDEGAGQLPVWRVEEKLVQLIVD